MRMTHEDDYGMNGDSNLSQSVRTSKQGKQSRDASVRASKQGGQSKGNDTN